VILSDGLWRRRFGADPALVGKSIEIAGGTVTVVGIMPATFRPLGNESYWAPFPIDPADRKRTGRYTMVIGRLKAGVTVAGAQAEMTTLTRQLEQEDPKFDTGWRADVIPLKSDIIGSAGTVLWMLLGAVALVLMITCANVGNLMLARAAERQHDLAVRTALGWSRCDRETFRACAKSVSTRSCCSSRCSSRCSSAC
jgi:ABC-type antimicrobial peptide transport system permease subunit